MKTLASPRRGLLVEERFILMALVGELTSLDHVSIAFSEPVVAAARKMRETRSTEVIVVDHGGRAVGILTANDIVARVVAEGRDPTSTSVGQVCSDPVATVRPDDDLNHARRLMMAERISCLPVIDELGRPLGVLTLGDLAASRHMRDGPFRSLVRATQRRPRQAVGASR